MSRESRSWGQRSSAVRVGDLPALQQAETDADGRFEIADMRPYDMLAYISVPAEEGGGSVGGPASLYVHHPNFPPQLIEYTKVPSEISGVLRRGASVKGRIVLAESGEPAAGARIEFYPHGWTPMSHAAVADDQGRYELSKLPAGDFAMFVEFKGGPICFNPTGC